jgi:hypothetical protein
LLPRIEARFIISKNVMTKALICHQSTSMKGVARLGKGSFLRLLYSEGRREFLTCEREAVLLMKASLLTLDCSNHPRMLERRFL